jgi:hypothetical protein
MVNDFITKTLEAYSEELQCYKEQLFIVIAVMENADGMDEVKLHLFKGNESIKEIQLETLLS